MYIYNFWQKYLNDNGILRRKTPTSEAMRWGSGMAANCGGVSHAPPYVFEMIIFLERHHRSLFRLMALSHSFSCCTKCSNFMHGKISMRLLHSGRNSWATQTAVNVRNCECVCLRSVLIFHKCFWHVQPLYFRAKSQSICKKYVSGFPVSLLRSEAK